MIVSTPSLCPPKRVNSEDQQGLVDGKGSGPEDTHAKSIEQTEREEGWGRLGGSHLLGLSL